MSKQSIWNKLRTLGFNEFATAGIMANIQAESAYISNNAQDGFGWDDDAYTSAVDNGGYSRDRFAKDSIGYGLCQWTYYTRKYALYDLAKNRNVSVSDEDMQLDFLLSELTSDYTSCYRSLQNATSAYDAAYTFCTQFERPANMESQGQYRGGIAQNIYQEFAGTPITTVESSPVTAETPEETSLHVVSYGDKTWYGNAVQSLLKAHGYDVAVDKDVRGETMEALTDFASMHGLDPSEDFAQLIFLLFEE